MPNWCEGTLKVRGEKENLTKFALEGLKPIGNLGDLKQPLKLDSYGDVTSEDLCWVEGTHRGFVEYVDVYLSELCSEGEDIICLDYRQAWAIAAEELLEVCKKYNLDMKIYAFECGMEINQDIEIVDGKIIKDDVIEFDSYNWECINPQIGG